MDARNLSFRTRAHAKINLALAVAPARVSDGLHPVCSWMHAIELCDEIEIHRVDQTDESHYSIIWASGAQVEWKIEDDLAVKAHRLVESTIGSRLPVHLGVRKSIPAGGGLGGGSSDAASVLIGLNALFDLKMPIEQLAGLGIELGSDLPFFLDADHPIPRAAIVEGCGEKITRLDQSLARTDITLFFPSFGCPTGRVYQAFDEVVSGTHKLDADRVHRCAAAQRIEPDALFNDLASASEQVVPELGELRRRLKEQTGRAVHVSGSGSTLFFVGLPSGDLAESGCSMCTTRLC